MSNINQKIKQAHNIEQLCGLLNEHIDSLDKEDLQFFEEEVDLTDLPLFSKNEPESTEGIFSYSDTHVMLQGNGSKGNHFKLYERSDLT